MNGFLVFLTFVIAASTSGGYSYALPGMYPAGREMIVRSEAACNYRDIEPSEEIFHNVRQIDMWNTGITFHEPGILTGLDVFCVHSIFQSAPDLLPVDWMIR